MNVVIIGCGYVGTAVARYWRRNRDYWVTATTTTKERVAELEQVAQRVLVTSVDDETALKAIVQNQDVQLVAGFLKSETEILNNRFNGAFNKAKRSVLS